MKSWIQVKKKRGRGEPCNKININIVVNDIQTTGLRNRRGKIARKRPSEEYENRLKHLR